MIEPKVEKSDFSQFKLDEYEEDGDKDEMDELDETKSMGNDQDAVNTLFHYRPHSHNRTINLRTIFYFSDLSIIRLQSDTKEKSKTS